jgi:pSer/pThr/pTyr-binding forkhead associated (FHA) protein
MKAGDAAANEETVVHNRVESVPDNQGKQENDKTIVSSKRPHFNPEATENDDTSLRVKSPEHVNRSDDEDYDSESKTIIQEPKSTQKTTIKQDRLNMSTMQLSRRSLIGDMAVSQKACLEVYGLKSIPVSFELNDKEFLLGRSQECHLVLPLYGVSRVHARIYFMNDEYYIEDMNSTNGSYVNGIKILKCILRNNDQIEIGEAKIIFIEERMRRA